MTAEWARVRALFEQAFGLSGDARAAYLAGACDGDETLAREVEDLLAAATDAGGLLEPPAMQRLDAVPAAPGTELAGYQLVRVIARGGMGVIYEAEQNEPRRRVALKMLHFGFVSGTAARRFRDEAAILARLRHPNIAAVHAAGVHVDAIGEEHPWFAMEFVDGARDLITDAEERHLPVHQRLRLFTAVCDAIQHGHQRSVIHRDVKADNVLVGSDGVPKVIDFGVARTTDTDPSPRTTAQLEAEIVGSLHAMSPEQLAGEVADTRADVYGLGVLLYELLCGALPYDLAGMRLTDAMRCVREQRPRRPSVHARPVRGDLERIVMKAIAKDPEQRYATAAALADDVRRWLRHEPVTARPPSLLYHLRLLARRHRAAVTASLLVFAAALVAAVISTRAAMRASHAEASVREQLAAVERAERRATEQGEQAARSFEQLLDLSVTMVSDFAERIGTQLGSLPVQRDMIGKSVAILESLAERSGGDRRLRLAIARAHLGLAGVVGDQWRRSLGDAGGAAASFRRAHEIAEALVAEAPSDAQARLLLAATTWHLASLDASAGRLTDAIERVRASLALREAVDAATPLHGKDKMEIAECHSRLAVLHMQQRDWEAARAELRQGRTVLEDLAAAEPDVRRWRIELALLQTREGALSAQAGALADALPLFAASVRAQAAMLEDSDPSEEQLRYTLATARSLYGVALRQAGHWNEAEQQMEQALESFETMIAAEPDSPSHRYKRMGCLAHLGHLWRDRARTTDAASAERREMYARARERYREALAASAELGGGSGVPEGANLVAEVEQALAECEQALARR